MFLFSSWIQIQRDYGDGSQGSDRFGNTFVIVDVYRTSTQDVVRVVVSQNLVGVTQNLVGGTQSLVGVTQSLVGGTRALWV